MTAPTDPEPTEASVPVDSNVAADLIRAATTVAAAASAANERIIGKLDELIDVGRDGTHAIRNERRWRRFSILLLTLGIVAGMMIGTWTWRVERADRIRSDRQTCQERVVRAKENRKVQERVAAYEARFYGRPADEVDRLSKGVSAIVAESLPLPTC